MLKHDGLYEDDMGYSPHVTRIFSNIAFTYKDATTHLNYLCWEIPQIIPHGLATTMDELSYRLLSLGKDMDNFQLFQEMIGNKTLKGLEALNQRVYGR